MKLVEIINYVIIVLYITLVVNSFFQLIKLEINIEYKIIKIATNVFMLLLIWSIYRFVNRIPEVNIYDYLIIILDGGLFIISVFNLKHI